MKSMRVWVMVGFLGFLPGLALSPLFGQTNPPEPKRVPSSGSGVTHFSEKIVGQLQPIKTYGSSEEKDGKGVPLRNQNDKANGTSAPSACGPTALGMAMEFFGKNIPTSQIIKEIGMNDETGATLQELIDLAKKHLPNSHLGFGLLFTEPMKYLEKHLAKGGLVIVPVQGNYAEGMTAPSNHFLLVTSIKDGKVYANDPAQGKEVVISKSDFANIWPKNGAGLKTCGVIHKTPTPVSIPLEFNVGF